MSLKKNFEKTIFFLLTLSVTIAGCKKAKAEEVKIQNSSINNYISNNSISIQTEQKSTAPKAVPAEPKEIIIGFICRDTSQIWLNDVQKSFEKTALTMGANQVISLNSNQNSSKCLENIDYLIDKKADVIVLSPVSKKDSQTIYEKCSKAEIPLITISEGLFDTNEKHLFPSFEVDNTANGSLMGEWLGNYINQNTNYGRDMDSIGYLSLQTDNNTDSTKKALLKKVPEFMKSKIFDVNYNGTIEKSFEQSLQTMKLHPEITNWLVTAPTDEGALGAVKALERLRLDRTSCVIGCGTYFSDENFQRDFTCFKASCYYSGEEAGKIVAEEVMNYITENKEIFSGYHDSLKKKDDTKFGVYLQKGIMIDSSNYDKIIAKNAGQNE